MQRRVLLWVLWAACSAAPGVLATEPAWIAKGRQGMVASDSPHASRAGLEILQAGGNAIDASVAVSFALGVTRPYSTGLGGGGFLIARFADGRILVRDSRETAPAAAMADMFIVQEDAASGGPPPSRYGHLAVAVPGLLAGRCRTLAEHGTMPLAKVMAPAIRLAKEGFPVDEHYVKQTVDVLKRYQRYPELIRSCSYVHRVHLRDGRLRSIGDTLAQPELGRLLEEISREGPDFFYRGPVASALAKEMRCHGGIITENDLAEYTVCDRKPVSASYRGYQVISMPPPSSGGIALIESLNILETVDLAAIAQSDSGLSLHYRIEAMKNAFADRARWLGDTDFVSVPVGHLTSKGYARSLADRIDPLAVGSVGGYGSVNLPDDSGTSHFCVADRWGNVVSSTETINTFFGSLAAVDEWGLILNNEMDDFVARPGSPNAYGLIQSVNNAIAPRKRPLSSMAPTIVLSDGAPHMLLGASGGPRIISAVLNVMVAVTDHAMSLEEAMRVQRPHHQWAPDLLFFDAAPPPEIEATLAARGHQIAEEHKTGIVQAILRVNDGWVGASDPRKGGRPAGY